MLPVNVLLTLSAFTCLMLAVLILASNARKSVNRSLSIFLFAIILWLLSNLFTNLAASPSLALWLARTTLIGATIMPPTFLIFCKIFTHQNLRLSTVIKICTVPFLVILTFPTSLNIVSIHAYGTDTVTGVIYIVLAPLLLGYFGWGLAVLARYYRVTKKPVEKAQLRYIFVGVTIAATPALITNAILPIFGNNAGILYGPNAVVLLAIAMTIAIVKHRLLDIRFIVARSLAYLLLLSTFVGLYAYLTFGFAVSVFGENQFSQHVIPVVMAIFFAFTVQPLRDFFARITNNFFYRDAYDSQAFLDTFNKTLVSTYDIETLLKNCADLIQSNLKLSYCVFIIDNKEGRSVASRRILGTNDRPKFTDKDIKFIHSISSYLKRDFIAVDFLEDKYEHVQRTLQVNNVAILARLIRTTSDREGNIGYLLLGPKKSGNLYSSQDIKVMEIVISELIIAMQNALRFEEIENFNATLQEKIDDATRKLRHVNDKLRRLNDTKDDFISMASHQLRTPLTSVKGYVSMVLDGDAGNITRLQRKLLTESFVSAQRMVYLISDLLNVSRLKTGKFLIEPTRCNLARVIHEEVEQLVETAKGRHLELIYNRPEHFPVFMMDETKIRQVIMNFLDNAVYYTPAGGRIEAHLEEKPQTIEFTVTDNGIGVPRHEQLHLFTKFYRAPNAKRARPDGTGLGLFMAKKVIIAQGGAIIFKSQEGKGSTFGFTFPKAQLAVDASTSGAIQQTVSA